jgi:hypothetical protein
MMSYDLQSMATPRYSVRLSVIHDTSRAMMYLQSWDLNFLLGIYLMWENSRAVSGVQAITR